MNKDQRWTRRAERRLGLLGCNPQIAHALPAERVPQLLPATPSLRLRRCQYLHLISAGQDTTSALPARISLTDIASVASVWGVFRLPTFLFHPRPLRAVKLSPGRDF
jgi:hypothetical protein